MKQRYTVVIRKYNRTLEVYDSNKLVKSYTVVLGFAPEGDKEIEGDGKTPEGEFYIFGKNPNSKFHLSLGISYPSTDDADRGLASKIIDRGEYDLIINAIRSHEMPPQKTRLGGEIYIHGGGIDGDWTCGCIAMENRDIEELFETLPEKTRVIIMP